MAISTLHVIAIAVCIAEVWFAFTAPDTVGWSSLPLIRSDPVLGWALVSGQSVQATLAADRRIIYSVTYTLDAHGHRAVPPSKLHPSEGCIFFFVDSVAFGAGVDDAESLPYQVATITRGRYEEVNFGVPGYGAEHMLANLERGQLSQESPCKPTHIIYLALSNHVLRVAGKTSFSKRGPRYHLDESGKLVGGSLVDEPKAWWQTELAYQLTKSHIYRALSRRPTKPTPQDAALYFAVVRQAFVEMHRRWPRAQRHVISWDVEVGLVGWRDSFNQGLATVDARVHDINAVLPGYTDNVLPYSIDPLELHPNARSYERVARYLVDALRLSSEPSE